MSIPIKVRYIANDFWFSRTTITTIMYKDIVNGKQTKETEEYIKDFINRLENLHDYS